jgi:hypothetical protein
MLVKRFLAVEVCHSHRSRISSKFHQVVRFVKSTDAVVNLYVRKTLSVGGAEQRRRLLNKTKNDRSSDARLLRKQVEQVRATWLLFCIMCTVGKSLFGDVSISKVQFLRTNSVVQVHRPGGHIRPCLLCVCVNFKTAAVNSQHVLGSIRNTPFITEFNEFSDAQAVCRPDKCCAWTSRYAWEWKCHSCWDFVSDYSLLYVNGEFSGTLRFQDVMELATNENVRLIADMQKHLQFDEPVNIQFTSVREHCNFLVIE